MSSSSTGDSSDLSEILTRSWHIDAGEKISARNELEKQQHTVSSIAEHYLRSRIDHCAIGVADNQAPVTTGSVSLVSLAIGKINQVLADSGDLQSDIVTIAKSLNSTTLCEVLRDGRLPYVVLRSFLDLPYETVARNESGTLGKLQDIDEAVLLNEKYIRARSPGENADGGHLVSIEDLGKICGHIASESATTMIIRRMEPPSGGFECLNEKRERTIEICANSQSYRERFHLLTEDILKGLDWSNVFLAGGMALTALMHTGEPNTSPHIQESDLDIFLYGLNADQANQKAEEIFNVWKNNLPANNQNILVVKNFKTINLIPDYPNRRIQIVLKLFKSPTQVFLGFDLDACAIGFDGTRALMLPRCARAIETGYNVFTMDFVWGHYLKGRNASREARVFKYADRGFGLRILPTYVKSLEEGYPITLASKIDKVATTNQSPQNDESEEVRALPYLSAPCRGYESREAYRMPAGPEAGIKTLKRVVYLGQDFTNRFCFGNTPLHYPSKAFLKEYPHRWIKDYEARKEHTQKRIDDFNRLLAEGKEPSPQDEGKAQELDSKDTFQDPDYRRSLAMLEIFVRRLEARRLMNRKEASFDFGESENPIDGDTNYYGFSSYAWDASFDAASLAASLDAENGEYFTTLKQVICAKLQIPYQGFGYAGYLTRRIRQQVHGPDLASVMEKQITIPMMVPYDLENFLVNVLPNLAAGFPTEERFLIPVHDPTAPPSTTTRPPLLPHLHDTGSEHGNLRYWVITNRSMWAGQNRIEDEVFETLWPLFNWFCDSCLGGVVRGCADPDAVWKMAESVRRRAVHPKPPSSPPDSTRSSTRAVTSGTRGLSPAEAMLFRAWVLAEPNCTERRASGRALVGMQRRFEDDAYLYPVPDELFWTEGEEGGWSGGSVPQWRYVPVEERAEGSPGSRKRKSSDALMEGGE